MNRALRPGPYKEIVPGVQRKRILETVLATSRSREQRGSWTGERGRSVIINWGVGGGWEVDISWPFEDTYALSRESGSGGRAGGAKRGDKGCEESGVAVSWGAAQRRSSKSRQGGGAMVGLGEGAGWSVGVGPAEGGAEGGGGGVSRGRGGGERKRAGAWGRWERGAPMEEEKVGATGWAVWGSMWGQRRKCRRRAC